MKMYSTPWCGYCARLKAQFGREGIDFEEVNIEDDPQAADLVASLNGGNHTVPTIVFDDGTTLTNPPLALIKEKLGLA